ncbi:SUKH-4 family immunity protein [Streptomyces caniscabiei]|uniref:SUKH-4 family immunity protein n=1 Tax=Streptomyces caniscabiei TaxID=2746961 RepID=A0ABU4MIT3_9ACTN|nr:SUKH-4 family immunity protein [Streptomyces caniscabiei]MBE4735213.1 SUKH-4 family immunity protein [Streptomyces caniscabiei]MBE4754347.1 SUKH-4 family immunity protein [Streptomyces caniscabiei]MBE4767939.1 SUKH-4 family immunity protein [Streptomyces caniscabiei]MBE4784395.1 SUKH-4 family immunity protein [Streptomyces caniscabiei]MBE4791106.1 SUKH-4 family immunity protein [Streptomyces caniscabiei]
MNDAEVASLLAGCARCPYPGVWQASPFVERTVGGARHALVAVDPGLSALAVRRDDGSLWCLPEGGVPQLVNSSVEAFVAFSRAYEEASAEAAAYEGPGDDGLSEDEAVDLAEEAADALTEALLERFGTLDADAVADENSFWHIGAEELGYSMSV